MEVQNAGQNYPCIKTKPRLKEIPKFSAHCVPHRTEGPPELNRSCYSSSWKSEMDPNSQRVKGKVFSTSVVCVSIWIPFHP